MVRAAVFFSGVAVANAVSCSSNDKASIQGMDDNAFGDASNKCGKDALSLLKGIDHDKFNSCMGGAIGISSACSECYAVTADYGFKNCKSACLLGWCKSGCLSCTAPAQTDLPACTGIAAGTATPCLETAAVSCSSNDQAAIQGMDDNAFGDASNKCGKDALSLLKGIDHDKFNSCMGGAIGISSACSECYAVTADYGFKHCKSACLLGWCKSGCLSCTAPAQTDLPACTGIAAGTATPCLETTVTGSCSSDDQTALADPQNVGKKQDNCGKKALGLTGINHDKFVSCVESDLGISAACSECYYATADYGFKNCKAACLLGWCKSGCLSCTKPAQDDLAACAGFATVTADPCMDKFLA